MCFRSCFQFLIQCNQWPLFWSMVQWQEDNVIFNNALNTFYLQLYGIGHMFHGVDPLSYFSFQPVLHDWCNKGCGMSYNSLLWMCKLKPHWLYLWRGNVSLKCPTTNGPKNNNPDTKQLVIIILICFCDIVTQHKQNCWQGHISNMTMQVLNLKELFPFSINNNEFRLRDMFSCNII